MADLSAYIDFSVVLDKSGVSPVIILTDTSAYPSGFAQNVTGIFSVTQPDGITVTGSFSPTPDIVYTGSVNSSTKELRLGTDGNFQKGLYSITYTVNYPSYSQTIKTKSFGLYYDQPVLNIVNEFDVFTPSLKINDQTNYLVSGFNSPAVGRAWHAVINNVGAVNGTGSTLDLVYSGKYYNSKYAVTLTAIVTYVSSSVSWVSVTDKLTTTVSYTTNVPTSLTAMYSDLTSYQSKLPECGCGCDVPGYTSENYVYAFTLFQHLIMRVKSGDTFNLSDMVSQIYCVLHNGSKPVASVTNTAIMPFNGTFPGNAYDPTNVVTALSISAQPASMTKNEGDSVTFSITPTGGVAPYSYQWRESENAGTSWTNLSGATNSNLTVSGLTSADNGNYYDVIVTDFTNATVTSTNAVLTVNTTTSISITYGYSTTDPYVNDTTAITVANAINATITHNANLSLNFPTAAQDNYVEVKVPAGESLKNLFNNGSNTLVGNTVPADEFRRFTYNGFTYYIARNPLGFDATQPLNFLA